MLDLRPSCEPCARTLPPAAVEARICGCKCTFCKTCIEQVLGNVCVNCGGGFVPRPARPAHDWHGDNCRARDPAGSRVIYRPVDAVAHVRFAAAIRNLPREQR
ncbi:DUF1272 domain-containing protein [soil metagenome]